MPIAKAFKSLAKTLTRSVLRVDAVIIMDDVPVSTKVIFLRRQEPMDLERQRWATAEPTIAVARSTLPRDPRVGDVVTFEGGEAWRIDSGQPEDFGAGMLEYPVKKHIL